MEITDFIRKDSLKIIAKPNAPKTRPVKWDEARDALRVDVHAHPENNKANIEIIKYFSKKTGKNVRIIKGLTSKEKILRFS